MKNQDRTAKIEHSPVAICSGSVKVIYSDAFEKRKKELKQEAVINRILARASKLDW